MSEAPPTARTRRWPRRLRRILGWGTLGIVLLAGIALGVFHTDWAQDAIRSRLEDRLTTQLDGRGTASIGTLDITLLGDIRVENVTLSTQNGTPLVQLDEAVVDLDWGSLTGGPLTLRSVSLTGANVQVTQNADGTSDLAHLLEPLGRNRKPRSITVDALQVSDLGLTLVTPDRRIALSGVTVKGSVVVDVEQNARTITLSEIGAGLRFDGPKDLRLTVDALKTSATIEARGNNRTITLGPLSAPAHLVAPAVPPRRAIDAKLPLSLEGATLKLTPSTVDASLSTLEAAALRIGTIEVALPLTESLEAFPADKRAVVGLKDVVIDSELTNALLGRTALKSDVTLDARAEGTRGELAVKGNVDTRGGKLALTGTLDLTDPKIPGYDLTLTGSDIVTRDLLPPIPDTEIPDVRGGITITAKGRGIRREDADVTTTLHITPIRVDQWSIEALDLEARFADQKFTLKKLTADALGRTITANAAFDPKTGGLSARINTDGDMTGTLKQLEALGIEGKIPTLTGLDVDLTVKADGIGGAKPRVVSTDPSLLPKWWTMLQSPFDTGSLVGSITARGFEQEAVSADELKVTSNLTYDRGIPGGSLTVAAKNLDVRDRTIETASVQLGINARQATLDVTAKEARTGLSVSFRAAAQLPEDAKTVAVTVERLEVSRKSLSAKLRQPVTVNLPLKKLEDPTQLIIPAVKLAIAGNDVTISGALHLAPGPDGTPVLDDAATTLVLEALDLGRVGRLLGKDLAGFGGIVSGTVSLAGIPKKPSVDLDIDARLTRRGVSGRLDVGLKASANERHANVEANLDLAGKSGRSRLLRLTGSVPLFTRHVDPTDWLAREVTIHHTAPWTAHLDVPERQLTTLLPWLPPRVRARLKQRLGGKGIQVAISGDLRGSAARPSGELTVNASGRFAPKYRQTLDLTATWVPSDKGSRLAGSGTINFGLPDRRAKPARLDFTALLPKRPTRARPINRWDLTLEVPETPLAALPLPPKARERIRDGQVALNVTADGTLRDANASVTLKVRELAIDALRGLRADITANLSPKDTRWSLDTRVGDVPLLVGNGKLGVSSRALLSGKRPDPKRLAVSGNLRLDKRPLKDLAFLKPELAKLPGQVGATLEVNGTVGAPRATLVGGWTEVPTLAGTTASAKLNVTVDPRNAGATITWGGETPEITITASTPVAPLRRGEPIVVTTSVLTESPTLLPLLPKVGRLAELKLPVDGHLHTNITGNVTIVRGAPMPLSNVALQGPIVLDGIEVPLPGSKRVLKDGALRLQLRPDGITLEKLGITEEYGGVTRTVAVTGGADWPTGNPLALEEVTATILADQFLLIGPPDAPQGELSAEIGLKLAPNARTDASPGTIDVAIKALKLISPNRFMMRHAGEMASKGDLFYVDELDGPVGKLPPQVAKGVPAIPDLGRWNVRVEMPKAGALIHKSPLYLQVTGAIDARLGDKTQPNGLYFAGRLNGQSGHLEFLGHDFPLRRGAIILQNDCPGCLDLTFAGRAHHTIQREFSRESADGVWEVVHIGGSFAKPIVSHRGVGGGFLVDTMSTRNAHRPRRRGLPDRPASNTVQFPEEYIGSMIPTLLSINLPHLLLAHTSEMWADPYDNFWNYGQMRHGLIDRYFGKDAAGHPTSRLVIRARPRTAGRSDSEIGYDWVQLSEDERSLFGIGVRVGTRGGGGPHLFWEWSTRD